MYYSVKPSSLFRLFYPQAIWNIKTTEKKIYLTFDDGPIPEVTDFVLDTLKQYNAKASFFCVGNNVAKNNAIYERIITNAHTVGNHTFSHTNGWRTANDYYYTAVERCSHVVKSNFFRPPYGKLKPSQYNYLSAKYKIVMWSVLPGDFDQSVSPEQCLANCINNIAAGDIVVLHDSLKAEKNMTYTLPRMLNHFSEKGFVFDKL